jgi:hypothetical protein
VAVGVAKVVARAVARAVTRVVAWPVARSIAVVAGRQWQPSGSGSHVAVAVK